MGKGGILGQYSPQAAGALALLRKLSDGSARRYEVRWVLLDVIEALAVGLAVAIIVIVEVDGHERLAIFSFAHVPALTDALRVTHELVHAGEVLPGLVVLAFSRGFSKIVMLRANNFMVFRALAERCSRWRYKSVRLSTQSRRRLRKLECVIVQIKLRGTCSELMNLLA